MNISCQFQQIFLWNHFNTFYTNCLSTFFQIQFFRNWNHKHIMFLIIANRYQCFKYLFWIFVTFTCNAHTINQIITHIICMNLIRYPSLIQNSHRICFRFFLCHILTSNSIKKISPKLILRQEDSIII